MFNQCCCGFPAHPVRLFLCIASMIQVELMLSFCVNISPKCLTVATCRVIIPIQAVRLTLGAVLKWTFSKLPASNVGRGGRARGVDVTGDCWGQVATDCRNVLEVEFFVRVPWTVLGFHLMFLDSVMNITHNSGKPSMKELF